MDGLASNPGLVLFAVHPTLHDDAEANVNDINIAHLEASTAGVHISGEEVEDEGIKPVGGVPIGSHALPVHLAISGRCLTILVDDPEEEVNKDDINLAEVPLLEGSMHLGQHGLKEDIGKGSVHCCDVCSHLLVSRMHRTDRGAIIIVNARGVAEHIRYLRREGRKGVRVCFHGEKSVDIARSCTEEQVHCHGGGRSLHLGTAAEVKMKFNQGLKRGNSLDWFGQRWESRFHIQKGGCLHSGHS